MTLYIICNTAQSCIYAVAAHNDSMAWLLIGYEAELGAWLKFPEISQGKCPAMYAVNTRLVNADNSSSECRQQ